MPRRKWRQPTEDELAVHYRRHHCSAQCPAKTKMDELFGVLTYNITNEVRANGNLVPDEEAVVKGDKLRSFIGLFLGKFSEALRTGELKRDEFLWNYYSKNNKEFLGLLLGCLTDLCFSLEYIRRCGSEKWAYCTEHGEHRAFYSYLGVCPHCVISKASPKDSALNIRAKKGGRYFGNKIDRSPEDIWILHLTVPLFSSRKDSVG